MIGCDNILRITRLIILKGTSYIKYGPVWDFIANISEKMLKRCP